MGVRSQEPESSTWSNKTDNRNSLWLVQSIENDMHDMPKSYVEGRGESVRSCGMARAWTNVQTNEDRKNGSHYMS